MIGNAARNAAVAYGLLGGILSLSLAATAGCLLPRFSLTRILTAGLAGIALGALFGAASSYVVTPLYFNRLGTADVTLSLLIHLAIWSAIGAAAGVAFGIGCGTRKVLAGSLIGGITGGALAALLFDVCGAFLPLARTERPLAEQADTRLAAAALLSVFVVLGTVIVALQEPRAKVPKAVESNERHPPRPSLTVRGRALIRHERDDRPRLSVRKKKQAGVSPACLAYDNDMGGQISAQ